MMLIQKGSEATTSISTLGLLCFMAHEVNELNNRNISKSTGLDGLLLPQEAVEVIKHPNTSIINLSISS